MTATAVSLTGLTGPSLLFLFLAQYYFFRILSALSTFAKHICTMPHSLILHSILERLRESFLWQLYSPATPNSTWTIYKLWISIVTLEPRITFFFLWGKLYRFTRITSLRLQFFIFLHAKNQHFVKQSKKPGQAREILALEYFLKC